MAAYYPINYDFHRMVIFTALAGAIVSALGLSISLIAKYLQIGSLVFNQRPDFLGNYIDSPLAYIFNMGLILAGICILLAMYGLQQLRLGHFGNYISIAGFTVGAFIILIGIYPINYLFEHRLFSTVFLISTLILYFLTLCSRLNHKDICPLPLFGVSLLGFISASLLALMLNWSILDFSPCTHQETEICAVSLVMWCQTNLVMVWCIMLALTIKKLARQSYQKSIVNQLTASY
ncbi:DUF998 domain-containing protein [Shewanella mesophila]|uniref:DUF998 domain-containing protein n=1 Tax=Shewanella mesophila TaxID=2864208 RepID=UPI001C65D932|nr:DUF998 domain-containing protein [Shewanella mesophila]QYJ85679.1 DUF998 domain-containing protein [Shewanella mesophila]